MDANSTLQVPQGEANNANNAHAKYRAVVADQWMAHALIHVDSVEVKFNGCQLKPKGTRETQTHLPKGPGNKTAITFWHLD